MFGVLIGAIVLGSLADKYGMRHSSTCLGHEGCFTLAHSIFNPENDLIDVLVINCNYSTLLDMVVKQSSTYQESFN